MCKSDVNLRLQRPNRALGQRCTDFRYWPLFGRSAISDLSPECAPKRTSAGPLRIHEYAALLQSCAPKTFQIMLAIGVLLDRHVVCEPGQRDVGLSTAKLL
jgi:hypothetical protein